MTPNNKDLTIIGLTGNTGSGKTTVARILEGRGVYIINADKIARDVLLKGGAGYEETVELFGRGILQANGEIDRPKLGNIVFNDPQKLKALNNTTHKHVLRQIDAEISYMRKEKSHKIICLDVPLLFEAGLDVICDITWVVDACDEIKLKRVAQRDKIDINAAKARLKSQTKSSELRQKCDKIIENNTGYDELEAQVLKVLKELEDVYFNKFEKK